jgi:hypothetical protein
MQFALNVIVPDAPARDDSARTWPFRYAAPNGSCWRFCFMPKRWPTCCQWRPQFNTGSLYGTQRSLSLTQFFYTSIP